MKNSCLHHLSITLHFHKPMAFDHALVLSARKCPTWMIFLFSPAPRYQVLRPPPQLWPDFVTKPNSSTFQILNRLLIPQPSYILPLFLFLLHLPRMGPLDFWHPLLLLWLWSSSRLVSSTPPTLSTPAIVALQAHSSVPRRLLSASGLPLTDYCL